LVVFAAEGRAFFSVIAVLKTDSRILWYDLSLRISLEGSIHNLTMGQRHQHVGLAALVFENLQ
jgi:hypothetical protein